jgi:HD-GYP domain-containing protein (c-di-GMP phosphodiesterase class II)
MIKAANRRPAVDLAEQTLQRLATCLGVRRSHDKGHSRARAAVIDFIESVMTFLESNERDTLRLVVRDRRLTHDGRALGLGDGTIAAVGKLLSNRECGGVVFREDVTGASVNALLDWLMGRRARPASATCSGMEVLEPSALDLAAPERAPLGLDDLRRVFHLAEAGHALLEQVANEIRQGHSLDSAEIREFARWTADVVSEEGLRIAAPALLRAPPPGVFGHASHVYLLSMAMLHVYARDRAELEQFSIAALLHDIGLSRVPIKMLRKSKRNEDDLARIQLHPEYGADILLNSPGIPSLAVEVAFCHHIRDENTGFPATSRRMRPGPVTDVVQVADRIENLISTGPGREAMLFRESLGSQIKDPELSSKQDVIHAFHTGLTPTPPGSRVRVKSGAVGVVIDAFPEQPQRPRIALIEDSNGRRIGEPVSIDLRESDDEQHQIEELLPRPKS